MNIDQQQGWPMNEHVFGRHLGRHLSIGIMSRYSSEDVKKFIGLTPSIQLRWWDEELKDEDLKDKPRMHKINNLTPTMTGNEPSAQKRH